MKDFRQIGPTFRVKMKDFRQIGPTVRVNQKHLFHNGLDFFSKLRAKFKGTNDHHADSLLDLEFQRLSLNERIQHFTPEEI